MFIILFPKNVNSNYVMFVEYWKNFYVVIWFVFLSDHLLITRGEEIKVEIKVNELRPQANLI